MKNKTVKTGKRILEVKLRRMVDDSPDTSYLGEYSNRPETDYAIDRTHSLDCKSINTIREDYLYTHDWDSELPRRCTYCDMTETEALEKPCPEYDFGDDCDCNGGDMGRGEYRYFNPAFVSEMSAHDSEYSDKENRKMARQVYDRMERLHRGDWYYFGIWAEAEVQTGSNVLQHISSGGLWGIESDSDRSYITETEQGELANLRDELLAAGFSRRAISQAFKNVQEVDS